MPYFGVSLRVCQSQVLQLSIHYKLALEAIASPPFNYCSNLCGGLGISVVNANACEREAGPCITARERRSMRHNNLSDLLPLLMAWLRGRTSMETLEHASL